MIEVLAYFELRIIHTSDRKCDSPFESVEKRHGCVWVACQSNMHVCCLHFLCMCSARYYRWKWLEGHTSSAPPKHDSEVKSFIHRFRCVICENRNWKTPLYRDLRCAFQITFCDVIWHTHSLFCIFWILIQNAHLELKFKIRTLPSCENSLRDLHVLWLIVSGYEQNCKGFHCNIFPRFATCLSY